MTTENQPINETKDQDRAKDQAKAQLDGIKELIQALQAARTADDDNLIEEAEQAIKEDCLSVERRKNWEDMSVDPAVAEYSEYSEYKILLCWGGPACRIVGDLEDGEPTTARIEYQDWGINWTDYPITGEEEDILLEYCRCFYFGD